MDGGGGGSCVPCAKHRRAAGRGAFCLHIDLAVQSSQVRPRNICRRLNVDVYFQLGVRTAGLFADCAAVHLGHNCFKSVDLQERSGIRSMLEAVPFLLGK